MKSGGDARQQPAVFAEEAIRPSAGRTRHLAPARRSDRSARAGLFGAQASSNADRFKGFAEECMAEYDLDGWKVPDITDPGELSYHVMRGTGRY